MRWKNAAISWRRGRVSANPSELHRDDAVASRSRSDSRGRPMPRLKQRLPSASGGGPPPEFDIDDALRRQIETRYLASVDLTDKPPEFLIEFYAQLVEATRQYLWTASLTASAEPIDLRTTLINQGLIAAKEFQNALDAINAGGDAGDHINALLERHF